MSEREPGFTENNEVLLYQTEEGETRLEIQVVGSELWLSLNQIAELYNRDKSVVSRHIAAVFEEEELARGATVASRATVQTEGGRHVKRQIDYYNLAVVIAVGYRIKSTRGTTFRIWATEVLREYATKGFALDDTRLKQAGGGTYFDELLARIRDIRSSEKVFWRKVLDIYATSIDYDGKSETSQEFFATVQNKMHWAIHGHTAAEIVFERADASKPNMGITNYPGAKLRKGDVSVAKNYLSPEELEALNRIVTAYLEFAELQAMNRRPMTMRDWALKLDDFLKLSEREILTHAGKVSHEAATLKASREFEAFRRQQVHVDSTSRAEKDFNAAVKKLKQARAVKLKPGNDGEK